MDRTAWLGPIERIHTAAHGFIRHVNTAQPRIMPHLLQHTVIGQVILLHAFDYLRVNAAVKDLMQPVKEAAHPQPMRGKLPVAGYDQHLAIRHVGCQQPGCDPARFDHILPDMIQAPALVNIRITGHHRNSRLHQPVDLLAHGKGIGGGKDQAVDPALLQPADRLKIRAVRAVFQFFHQHGHIVQSAVMHRNPNPFPHTPDKKRLPARQNHADAVSRASRTCGLPLRRCFITVFIYHFLHPFTHFRCNIRPPVYDPIHRSARNPALIRNPLCSYLHNAFPFAHSAATLRHNTVHILSQHTRLHKPLPSI